ncbi:MAG: flagellar biosynthesis protein FlhA [Myxococcota bacterium]
MHLQADTVLVFGLGVVAMVLLVPLPGWVLDVLLAANISFAAVIFVSVVLAETPLALSTFPSLLLITTITRLALNLSSTRLILSEGHGSDVVESFGAFVVRGDVVLGLVMFAVLTLIQLLVVGKGAERVAEVGARFTLDALPGKQMAIDAALRSGSLSEEEARVKRGDLQRESQFHGAMDGAMKFVKGDAMAGLLITGLDLGVGLAIGMMRQSMSFSEAVARYGLLTVGDGLVAQIPALFVTLAAGMLTTRVASDRPGKPLGRTLETEILEKPKVLLVGGTYALVLGLVPGLPLWPFALVGLSLAVRGAWVSREQRRASQPERAFERVLEAKAQSARAQRSLADRALPSLCLLGVDVGPELTASLGLGSGKDHRSELIADLIPQLRNALYLESGVKIPGVRVRSQQPGLTPGGFRILVKEVPVAEGFAPPDRVLVCTPPERIQRNGIEAQATRHPVHGQPAAWVEERHRRDLVEAGYQTWSAGGVLALHLARVARTHLPTFVGLQETSEALTRLERTFPSLVREVVPGVVSLAQLTDVLRKLVEERVSIRDLRSILDALAEAGPDLTDPRILTERARSALSLQLAHACAPRGRLDAVLLDPAVEASIRDAIQVSEAGCFLALAPDFRAALIVEIANLVGKKAGAASSPVVLTHNEIRRVVRKLLEPSLPEVIVLSFQELPAHLPVQAKGRVTLENLESARAPELEAPVPPAQPAASVR